LPQSLNHDQKRILTENGHVMVVATAGSGKTKTLIAKASSLLSGNPSTRIASITFTRHAADEFKSRVAKSDSLKGISRRIEAGTFHSLALKMLKSVKPKLKVINESQSVSYLQKAWTMCDTPGDFSNASICIKEIKNNLALLENDPEIKRLFLTYYGVITRAEVCDFDDIMVMAVNGLRKGAIEPLLVSHILVDEFQDTSNIQYQFLEEHIKSGIKVIAVADDDQSIYAFRGSNGYDGINTFVNSSGASIIKLPINYRCSKKIVEVANKLVSCNKNRIPKALVSGRGTEGAVITRLFDKTEKELYWLINYIEGTCHSSEDYHKWAILHRSLGSIRSTAAALKRNNIPYKKMVKVPSNLDNKFVLGVIAFIHSVQGNEHGLGSVMVSIGAAQDDVNLLNQMCKGHLCELSLANILSMNFEKMSEQAIIWTLKQKQYMQMYMDNHDQLIEQSFNAFKNIPWLRSNPKKKIINTVEVLEDDIRVEILSSALLELQAETGPIDQRISNIRFKETLEDEREANTENAVRLYTIHGSKGLEFDYVAIPYVNNGTLPTLPYSPNDLEDGSDENAQQKLTAEMLALIEEERRIFFVGITRAKYGLLISGNYGKESPFIKEAGLFHERIYQMDFPTLPHQG